MSKSWQITFLAKLIHLLIFIHVVFLMYLQEACVGPDRQVKFRSIGNEENIAVDVDGGSYWPKQKREYVARLMGRDKNRQAEIANLKTTTTTTTKIYFVSH